MVTGVGFNTPASCAAIRVGITGFVETKFMFDGEFIQGCPVPLETPYRGRQKLIEMAAVAIEEAVEPLLIERYATERVPLLLCLSEPDRPGRFAELDDTFLSDISERLKRRFHAQSAVIAGGRVGGVKALTRARQIIDRDAQIQRVLVCGVDTFLVAGTLNHYHEQRRLLTAGNSDGFIPGEAACAVVLGPTGDNSQAIIAVTGIGLGKEPAPIDSGLPLRADGLVAAIKQAVHDADADYPEMAYRLTDNSGEQYGFKETVLAMTRVVRPTKPKFDIEHPADCIGEVGAAIVPALLAVANMAERKSYAPGRFMGDVVLCHVGADCTDRAAFILRATSALRNAQGSAA
jgi:3-oxoacyl-[acyl-carrier-protein] synthase-1